MKMVNGMWQRQYVISAHYLGDSVQISCVLFNAVETSWPFFQRDEQERHVFVLAPKFSSTRSDRMGKRNSASDWWHLWFLDTKRDMEHWLVLQTEVKPSGLAPTQRNYTVELFLSFLDWGSRRRRGCVGSGRIFRHVWSRAGFNQRLSFRVVSGCRFSNRLIWITGRVLERFLLI